MRRDTLLGDLFLLAQQSDAAAPMRREFAVEHRLLDDTDLIVGLQALLQGDQVELELLVAGQEVRLDELSREAIAGLGHRRAAQVHGGCQVQLLGVAEQVAVDASRR